MTVRQTLAASRTVPWADTLTYDYTGGALPPIDHIALQLRLYPGQPNDAKLTLPAISWVDALLSGTPGEPDEVRRLTLNPYATRQQLQALPSADEAGDDIAFSFDIRITYADEISEILSSGDFVLSSGVTTV